MIRLKLFAEAASFDGREAMMRVVEEMQVGAEFLTQALEKTRDEIQVELGAPGILERGVLFSWLVIHFAATDTIDTVEAGDTALCANGFVAEFGVLSHRGDGVVDI